MLLRKSLTTFLPIFRRSSASNGIHKPMPWTVSRCVGILSLIFAPALHVARASSVMCQEASVPIPVVAPRLGLYRDECNNDKDRRYLERLNERAKHGRWRTDSWLHTTDHVLIVFFGTTHKNRDTRANYFGDRLLLGGDERGQYVTELDPNDPDVTAVTSGTPEEMADVTADWFEDHLPGRRLSRAPRPGT